MRKFGVLTITLSLTACGGSGSGGNQPPAGPGTPPPVDPQVKPVLSEVAALGTVHSFTPEYKFYSDSAGTLNFIGHCSSVNSQVVVGENTITFDALANGTYDDCQLTVTNDAGLASLPLTISSFTIYWKTHPLNDSGQTQCVRQIDDADRDPGGMFGCADTNTTKISDGEVSESGDSVPGGQDAVYGRDADNKDDTDGEAGFSFSKLDQDGNELAFSAVDWSCVRDNVTGLVWRKELLPKAVFDATPTVDSVCGIDDWRVPALLELISVVNYHGGFEKRFADNLWPMGKYWIIEQSDGLSTFYDTNYSTFLNYPAGAEFPAILVSGQSLATQSSERFIINDNNTVTDIVTGLMWQRCTSGETFNATNGVCEGAVLTQTWYQALQLAMSNQFAGLEGWRLPNLKELTSLADFNSSAEVTFNSDIFPTANTGYIWTSTPGRVAKEAYRVQVIPARISWQPTTYNNAVLLVRDVE